MISLVSTMLLVDHVVVNLPPVLLVSEQLYPLSANLPIYLDNSFILPGKTVD